MKTDEEKKDGEEQETGEAGKGMTRRGFLTTRGTGAVTRAMADNLPASPAAEAEMTSVASWRRGRSRSTSASTACSSIRAGRCSTCCVKAWG